MNKAAVSYVENTEGKILCVFNRRYKGFSLPGGKVEMGETLEAACARELKEETGMDAISIVPMFDGPSCVEVEPGRGRWVYLFRVEASGEAKETEKDCPVQWMTKAQLIAISPFAEYYKQAFKFPVRPKMDKKTLDNHCSLLRDLDELWYSYGNPCGGLLHIILDDSNVLDKDLDFCRREVENQNPPHKHLAICILNMLQDLSPAQRWYWWQYRSTDEILSVADKNIESTSDGWKII